MTLYDLANATTIQGNVEVRVFSCGEELIKFQYPDCEDFAYSGYRNEDYAVEDMDVLFMYSIEGDGRKIWTVVEVEAND